MKFIDMHCDTLMKFTKKSDTESLLNNSISVDFTRMKKGGALAQFFAMFLLPGEESWKRMEMAPMTDWEYINRLSEQFYDDLKANSDLIAFAGNYDDMIANEKAGKMSAFLTIEDGRFVENDMANLIKSYEKGVRLISLTWNGINCIGYPHVIDPATQPTGLTEFGKEVVHKMNEMGMIVDVSHLSDAGFWDVLDICKKNGKPFVASHSNLRSVSPHTRNLTEDMLKALSEAGGCTGINFAPGFLDSDITAQKSKISDMAKHMLRMKDVGGIEVVALGSDLDGITGELEIDSVDKTPMLFDELKKVGFTEGEIEKVAYHNVARVIKAAMK